MSDVNTGLWCIIELQGLPDAIPAHAHNVDLLLPWPEVSTVQQSWTSHDILLLNSSLVLGSTARLTCCCMQDG